MTGPTDSFDTLFRRNMGVSPGERIVVFADLIRPDERLTPQERERRERLLTLARDCAAYASATCGNASFVSFPATTASGVEPPVELWVEVFGPRIVDGLGREGILDPLLAKRVDDPLLETARRIVERHRDDVADVVIALSNNSTSHTSFRRLACHGGCRFASLPHFDPDMFLGSMLADPGELARRTRQVADAVNSGVFVILSTPLGTSLTMSIRGRHAEGDDGNLTRPGSFGNLPAGEVYLAPVEGSASGTMVVTHAPTRELSLPLTFVVHEGNVVEIRGDDPYRLVLEERFASSPACRNVAELGIGTNDRATRVDNVLEAEKILGTVHVALGDNSGFGGRVSAPFHEDFVLFSPTLEVVREDGSKVVILRDGVLFP